MSTGKAVKYGAAGAAGGAALGPWGAVIGGAGGALIGALSSDDDPPPPPPTGPAPQIDPNAGLGSGFGGWNALSPEQQAAIQQRQANANQAAQLEAAWAAAKKVYAANPTPENHMAVQNAYFDRMKYNQARNDPAAPDTSDPTRFSNLATMAHTEQGPMAPHAGQVNLDPNAGLADYANYQQDRGQFAQVAQNFAQDRAQLGGVADAVRQRALGLGGPSVAELQMQQGNQMAMQNALSIANSQRGGGGSLASIEALRSNAGQSQDYNRQAAMLRAQEQMGAQQQYAGMNTAQQGLDVSQQNAWLGAGNQDLGARQQSFGQGLQAGQFQVGQNQFNTGLDAQRQQQQQQLNAMREQQYLNAYMQTHTMQQQNAQFNAQLQAGNQGLASSNYFQQQQLNQQRQAYQDQQMNAYLNMGATGLAALATQKPTSAAAPTQPASKPYDPYDPGF